MTFAVAHGLKTPLAVLSQESDRAAAAGHHELAAIVAQQVERMRRQIDYHLAHARAAAPGARCSVQAPADGIARTLLRLHADRGVAIQVHVPPQHWMRGQREDLDEILGNLLDNACTWARSRVIVTSAAADGALVIDVDDDGPGLPPAMWEAVLADEAAPGPGFGLAIVRDLAELYGGSIALGRAPAGGCVRGFSCPPDDARREAARPPGMHRRRTALVKRARRRAGSRSRAS